MCSSGGGRQAEALIRLRNRSLRNRRLGNTSPLISPNRRINFVCGPRRPSQHARQISRVYGFRHVSLMMPSVNACLLSCGVVIHEPLAQVMVRWPAVRRLHDARNPIPKVAWVPGRMPDRSGGRPGRVVPADDPGSSSGRTRGFGPLNGGSNPSPGATSLEPIFG